MIDVTEQVLAQAIIDTNNECIRLREEGGTPEQIERADFNWIDAQEAYVTAGYSLEAFETR